MLSRHWLAVRLHLQRTHGEGLQANEAPPLRQAQISVWDQSLGGNQTNDEIRGCYQPHPSQNQPLSRKSCLHSWEESRLASAKRIPGPVNALEEINTATLLFQGKRMCSKTELTNTVQPFSLRVFLGAKTKMCAELEF